MAPASASYEASSVRLIAEEAQRRNIQVTHYDFIRLGFIRLTLGAHVEYMFQTQTDKQGRATARFFTDNKVLGTYILREAGFPVPDDVLAHTFSEAQAFLKTYGRIVVKPLNGEGGHGITLDVTTDDHLREALGRAKQSTSLSKDSGLVVCQEHVDGRDYRILVVNYEHVFVVERIPAHVVGDGTLMIRELLTVANADAVAGYEIKQNDIAERLLVQQGLTWDSVPSMGQHVRLAQVANSHAGGVVKEANGDLGKAARELVLNITKQFKLSMVGIDCLTPDLSQGLGKILELNSCPALFKHHYPDVGDSQVVAPHVLDMLFPETKS